MSLQVLFAFSPALAALVCVNIGLLAFATCISFHAMLRAQRAEAFAQKAHMLHLASLDNHTAFLCALARRQGWDLQAEIAKQQKVKAN